MEAEEEQGELQQHHVGNEVMGEILQTYLAVEVMVVEAAEEDILHLDLADITIENVELHCYLARVVEEEGQELH